MRFKFRGGVSQPNSDTIEKFLLFCIDTKKREIPFSTAKMYGLLREVGPYEFEAVGNIIGFKVFAHRFSTHSMRRNLEVFIRPEMQDNSPIITVKPFSMKLEFYFEGRGQIVEGDEFGIKRPKKLSDGIPQTIIDEMVKVAYPTDGVRRIRMKAKD